MRKIPLLACLALVLAAAPMVADENGTTDAPPRDAAPATSVVEALHTAMLAALERAAELGYAGRVELLAPAVSSAFDLAFMAEKSLGSHWRSLTEPERVRWLDLFERYMAASYASRLDGFRGQRFETLGAEPGGRDTIAVRTKVVNPGDEDVLLTYRLREIAAGWRVIDIYLKGTVSELAVRRSDYAAVLRSGGFAALCASVEKKITQFAENPA